MQIKDLENLIGRLLAGVGMNEENASLVTDIFMKATLRGVGHHDVYNLPDRLEMIHSGQARANPEIKLLSAHGGAETYDGGCGIGELCCGFAMDRAMALAREHAVGLCAIRHSNHFLGAAPYVERAAERGFFGLVFTNTLPAMAGPVGGGRIIGNNPMGYAAPSGVGVEEGGQTIPFLLDIAMAYTSWGNINEWIRTGQKMPELWAKDADGNPTDDPEKALHGGTATPMAEHKGFGLAIMNELLTAGLAGGEMTDELLEVEPYGLNTHSQAALAIDIGKLIPLETFEKRAARMVRSMRRAQSAVRMPGERSFRSRSRFLREGIELSGELAGKLDDWARRLGVER